MKNVCFLWLSILVWYYKTYYKLLKNTYKWFIDAKEC